MIAQRSFKANDNRSSILNQYEELPVLIRTLLSLILFSMLIISLKLHALEGIYYVVPEKYETKKSSVIEDSVSYLKSKMLTSFVKIPPEVSKSLMSDNVIVVYGLSALKRIDLSNTKASIIVTYISEIEFTNYLSSQYELPGNITAVFSSPPPLHQLALSKALYGSDFASSYVLSGSNEKINDLVSFANYFDIRLQIINPKDIDSVSEMLKLSNGYKTIILEKNNALFQRAPLDQILLRSYDVNRQGVIGLGNTFVSKGALASVYFTKEQLLDKLIKSILMLDNNNSFPPPAHPDDFSIAINSYLLRSLNLVKQSKEEIKSSINDFLISSRNN